MFGSALVMKINGFWLYEVNSYWIPLKMNARLPTPKCHIREF